MSPTAIHPWQPSTALRTHIDKLAFERQLPPAGRTYIDQCIKLGPSRKVQGRLGNIVTRFHSQKMATSVLLESRTGEYPIEPAAQI